MRSRLAVPMVLFLLACSPERPEQQVKRTFQDMVKKVEASDAPGTVAFLAPTFEGPDGLDKGTLQFMLVGIFREQKVGVTVLQEAVRVDKRLATQDVVVLLTGRSGKNLFPDDSSRKAYRLTWELKDKAWRLRRAEALAEPGR